MDENEELERIRALVARVLAAPSDRLAAVELAERIKALDEWLSGNGMFPLAWLPKE